MGVDDLPKGRGQPFYKVLVDGRTDYGAKETYVAQENILPRPVQPILHPKFGQPHFTGEVDEESGTWVPNPLLRELYPRDVAGCWMVDSVMPDGNEIQVA